MANPEIPEAHATALALAIGNAVLAAAALEKVLLGEIGRRQLESEVQPSETLTRLLTQLEDKPGGRLLSKLREQGIDDDLARRIDDVLRRRNRMVHGMIEDLAVATALVTGDGLNEVLGWIEHIEADCETLISELQPLTSKALEQRYGISIDEAARVLADGIDLDAIPDPEARKELETARGLIKLYMLPQSTGQPEPPT